MFHDTACNLPNRQDLLETEQKDVEEMESEVLSFAKCPADCASTCNIVIGIVRLLVISVAVLLTLLGEARLLKFGRGPRRS